MGRYILALDQGTTSSKAVLLNENQQIVGSAQKEIHQFYPRPGWVEQDPMEIYSTQYGVMMEVLAQTGVAACEIAAVGITNQRETTILWDRFTGKPIYPAIGWQCRRTAGLVQKLIHSGYSERIQQCTGLIPDAYFSATKIKWILDSVEGARQRAEKGEILFGTVDTWLLWKLTNGAVHATDYTNASRTMLYNIQSLEWDPWLLALFEIPRQILPEVKDSSKIYGYTTIDTVPVPIAGIAGDQQAALFGQTCFSEGEAKNTYGTGCFLLMNTGERFCRSKNGLLTTIAIGLDGHVQYALEGSVFTGGAVIKWLRDEMGLLSHSREAEGFAKSVPDTNGVYFVPAFTGLGAPYWDMDARGCLVGLTRGVTKAYVIRAAEEAIAYQCVELAIAMEKDTGMQFQSLKADGGASCDDFLLQFQADMLQVPVCRSAIRETTALGAAYLAGLGIGIWANPEVLKTHWQEEKEFIPSCNKAMRDQKLTAWQKAVQRSLKWARL